jgi:signal transduction histidine kinase
VQYISQYSYEYCEAASLPCRLDLPTEVPVLPLIAEARHNLFMVLKEALHNVLKHAHASEVRLSLKLHEGLLELRVEDNGRGFKADSVVTSQRRGLANMRHRMDAIGAALFIESSPGAGTSIYARWAYPKDWPISLTR